MITSPNKEPNWTDCQGPLCLFTFKHNIQRVTLKFHYQNSSIIHHVPSKLKGHLFILLFLFFADIVYLGELEENCGLTKGVRLSPRLKRRNPPDGSQGVQPDRLTATSKGIYIQTCSFNMLPLCLEGHSPSFPTTSTDVAHEQALGTRHIKGGKHGLSPKPFSGPTTLSVKALSRFNECWNPSCASLKMQPINLGFC